MTWFPGKGAPRTELSTERGAAAFRPDRKRKQKTFQDQEGKKSTARLSLLVLLEVKGEEGHC